MLKKLSIKKLVVYKKYQGAHLTIKGKKVALKVIRKHRLWEFFLVNKLIGSNPKKFGNRTLPSKIEYIPVEKEGSKTVIEYSKWQFDIPVKDVYFTTNYMKRLK